MEGVMYGPEFSVGDLVYVEDGYDAASVPRARPGRYGVVTEAATEDGGDVSVKLTRPRRTVRVPEHVLRRTHQRATARDVLAAQKDTSPLCVGDRVCVLRNREYGVVTEVAGENFYRVRLVGRSGVRLFARDAIRRVRSRVMRDLEPLEREAGTVLPSNLGVYVMPARAWGRIVKDSGDEILVRITGAKEASPYALADLRVVIPYEEAYPTPDSYCQKVKTTGGYSGEQA